MSESDTSSRGGVLADLHLAATFLTRLRLPPLAALPPGGLAGSMWAFPLVGAVVGGIGALVLWAAGLVLPPLVAALLALAVMALLTGALHEDGLADMADGFGGGRDKARKLEIMRDSRIGSYGVLALVLLVGLKAAALSPALPLALVAAAALSRAVMPAVLHLLPPARDDGLGAGAGTPSAATVWIALALGAAVVLLCLPGWTGFAALCAAALAALAVTRLARRQIGGHTGDVLGALQQITETAVLIAAVGAL
ncbi:adenosylcobinamide-GDP ribazoletransferase [Telmatospirillum sp. J64-1]|uniref:adenosylcobinamide-GDP ribazoletransferase n=1 Tax=Telmatospirillum sp. J64-1 TaxID=2502183 RepID=UPI00115DCC2C|nr:adenosylcobinamide-GDP ribazoletransferase [Telmatospirillum sp. J64-1]